MIDALRFVQGAVASKDFVPELTHFRIVRGHIMGFNGRLALCSPIDLDITVSPKATTFAKALTMCGDKVSLSVTPAGKLAVRSDGFRVYIDCIEDYAFDFYPTGDSYPVPAGFLAAVERMSTFIGEDASRPWSMAIHVEGGGLYATNNVIAVEYWLGGELPAWTIPHNAVKELLRIGQEPLSFQCDGRSLTFWYGSGKWLRTQLIEQKWPLEQFRSIFAKATPERTEEASPALFAALDKLRPFMPDKSNRVLLLGERVATHEEEGVGASVDVSGLPEHRAFNRDMLAMLGGVATRYNLDTEPAYFMGDRLRGVLMGMNL
jgi:hypothetical protein